jgi:hypothetical protein
MITAEIIKDKSARDELRLAKAKFSTGKGILPYLLHFQNKFSKKKITFKINSSASTTAEHNQYQICNKPTTYRQYQHHAIH